MMSRGLRALSSRIEACVFVEGGTSLASYGANSSQARTGEWIRYRVQASRSIGARSKVISVGLPEGQSLGACVIAGLKIRARNMEKSYSPISHPELKGRFELLVKEYGREGLGAYLCSLEEGDEIECKVKPARVPLLARNRLRHVGMVANGTGVAPFVNVIATLLNDPFDATKLSLVVSHSSRDDGLLVDELEGLANDRFEVTTVFTDTAPRIDETLLRAKLAPPTDDSLVLVCGTDAFVAAMAGPISRVKDDQGRKRKIQGPTLGVLGALGYQPQHVFKL